MARIHYNPERNYPTNYKKRRYNETPQPENSKSIMIVPSERTPPDKILSESRGPFRTTTVVTKKNQESKNNKLDWKDEHSSTFNKLKNKIHQLIENTHFDTTKQTSVKCDASAKTFGASTEQKNNNEIHKMAIASRFLNNQPDIAQMI